MLVFSLFFFVILELYVFIQLGSALGAFLTIALLFLTTFAGVSVLKLHGAKMSKLRSEFAQDISPAFEALSDLFLILSAILLIAPGFVSDALGALLLFPPARKGFIRMLAGRHIFFLERMVLRTPRSTWRTHDQQSKSVHNVHTSRHQTNTIEGEYIRSEGDDPARDSKKK